MSVNRDEVALEKKMEKANKIQDCLRGQDIVGHVVPRCGDEQPLILSFTFSNFFFKPATSCFTVSRRLRGSFCLVGNHHHRQATLGPQIKPEKRLLKCAKSTYSNANITSEEKIESVMAIIVSGREHKESAMKRRPF